MEGESLVTRSINYELHSSYIERDQMEGVSDVTQSIIDQLFSSDIELDQMKVKVVLLVVSLMNSIFQRSKEIK